MTIFFAGLLFLACACAAADNIPTCQPRDFHYELTECDGNGRWRVSVPTPGTCTGGAPNAPVRLPGCLLTCQSGEYFDMDVVDCRPCPAGSYSLGDVVRYDTWESLPDTFYTTVEQFASHTTFTALERERSTFNCSKSAWQTRGDYIAFPGGPCVATLVYTVRLVKPGTLRYKYQYPDDDTIFEFQAQNELCQSVAASDAAKWPGITEEGKWRTKTVQLPEGLNVLQWTAMGISGRQTKPLLIQSIEVSGVPPLSVCTACRNGTYAATEGSQECSPCPPNTHSVRGSAKCTACDAKTTYAPAGSSRCHKRPPCTTADYYEIHSTCDEHNNTQVTYRWLEPRTCRDDLPSSVRLPVGSERRKCPPCNPGMQMDKTTGACQFCPAATISDGVRPCKPCPPSTAPSVGLQLQWWGAHLPPFITTRCMSLEGYTGNGCSNAAAWTAAGDHIRSGHGHAADAYLILSLKLEKGFRTSRGSVSFTFELACQSDCQFVFMQSSPSRGVSVIQTWSGRSGRQHFSFAIHQNASYTFNWAFQKQTWAPEQPYGGVAMRLLDTDVARIYSINVTNTVEGGASQCLPCAQGSDASGCIPCPTGHYTEESALNGTRCRPCPPNTVVVDSVAVGPASCQACGPGLISVGGRTCATDCRPVVNGTRYDLRKIGSKFHEVRGSMLFTASGMQYFHVFNISLCAHEPVVCANNMTFPPEGEPDVVEAQICRTTLIPSQSLTTAAGVADAGALSPMSTQSVTLGDHLIGMTTETQLGDTTVLDEFVKAGTKDLHVFYATPAATKSCPKGRTTTVTLRCDVDQPGQGQVDLPSRCPDGTCDGCNFHFLWRSNSVCPICAQQDIKLVKSECVAGEQTMHYLAPKSCIMPDEAPTSKKVSCTTRIPFVLQVVIVASMTLAVLLCVTVAYCWKRNRRLEYKYMKLIHREPPTGTSSTSLASASAASLTKEPVDADASDDADDSAECETPLAAAESCALDDGEEEDEVSITVPIKGYGLINKIRSMTSSKSENGSAFETIQLTEAHT